MKTKLNWSRVKWWNYSTKLLNKKFHNKMILVQIILRWDEESMSLSSFVHTYYLIQCNLKFKKVAFDGKFKKISSLNLPVWLKVCSFHRLCGSFIHCLNPRVPLKVPINMQPKEWYIPHEVFHYRLLLKKIWCTLTIVKLSYDFISGKVDSTIFTTAKTAIGAGCRRTSTRIENSSSPSQSRKRPTSSTSITSALGQTS